MNCTAWTRLGVAGCNSDGAAPTLRSFTQLLQRSLEPRCSEQLIQADQKAQKAQEAVWQRMATYGIVWHLRHASLQMLFKYAHVLNCPQTHVDYTAPAGISITFVFVLREGAGRSSLLISIHCITEKLGLQATKLEKVPRSSWPLFRNSCLHHRLVRWNLVEILEACLKRND